jgi:hypothetical protein
MQGQQDEERLAAGAVTARVEQSFARLAVLPGAVRHVYLAVGAAPTLLPAALAGVLARRLSGMGMVVASARGAVVGQAPQAQHSRSG